MLIKNKGLTIRTANIDDAKILGKWWRNGIIMAHAGYPNGLKISDDKIAEQISSESDENCRRLIIEIENIPIGEMVYRRLDKGTAEIGIKICVLNQQNKGYGSQFIKMLVTDLFNNLGFEKIVLDTNLNNLRAQHVYEKIGFRKTQINIDSWKNQLGKLESSVEYELLKEDFITN